MTWARKPSGADDWARNVVALYAAMISTGHHFAQACYGDGEWKNILGTGTGVNDQGEAFCEALGEALRRTLTDHRGQWCVLWPGGAGAKTRRQAGEWIKANAPDLPILPFRPIGRAHTMGHAAPFFRALQSVRVILVGPEHTKDVPEDLLMPAHHVEVPHPTAWEVVGETCATVEDVSEPGDVVLFASGQASPLAIHRLAHLKDRTILDIGSVLDPHCGVYSRRLYRDEEWKRAILPRNVP